MAKRIRWIQFFSAILMNLSKAYDFIPHQLFIAKLEAYGLYKNNLNLLADYLSGRKKAENRLCVQWVVENNLWNSSGISSRPTFA